MGQPKSIIKKRKKIIALLVILFFLLFFIHYGNHHLVVSMYHYDSGKVPEGLDGYRIVQISDLHNARFGNDNRKLLAEIRALRPDMIVLTGDLVDSNHTDIDAALSFVNACVDISPVYYVTGNHECWLSDSDGKRLQDGIRNAGAVILSNEKRTIGVDDSTFELIGLEDRSLGDNTLSEIIKECEGEFTIVLAHEPQYFHHYCSANADLVLSGHAHGGQFRLPFIGGVVAPDQGFDPEYTEGTYIAGKTTMIVSRGLGNSIIPVRLFNDPEIVCIELCHQ